jgi:hypothetical protein
MVGRKSLSISDVRTMVDHEIGHAKDVLDHNISFKDMNADVIDLRTMQALSHHYMKPIIFDNIRKMNAYLANDNLSDNEKRQRISKIVDEYVIVTWFCEIHYYLNSSEIV